MPIPPTARYQELISCDAQWKPVPVVRHAYHRAPAPAPQKTVSDQTAIMSFEYKTCELCALSTRLHRVVLLSPLNELVARVQFYGWCYLNLFCGAKLPHFPELCTMHMKCNVYVNDDYGVMYTIN